MNPVTYVVALVFSALFFMNPFAALYLWAGICAVVQAYVAYQSYSAYEVTR
jgi:uncharacterized protein (DUF486 family)